VTDEERERLEILESAVERLVQENEKLKGLLTAFAEKQKRLTGYYFTMKNQLVTIVEKVNNPMMVVQMPNDIKVPKKPKGIIFPGDKQ
jgi:esterase/lipase